MKHTSYHFASMYLGVVVWLVLCTTVTFQHLVQPGGNFFPFFIFIFLAGTNVLWWVNSGK